MNIIGKFDIVYASENEKSTGYFKEPGCEEKPCGLWTGGFSFGGKHESHLWSGQCDHPGWTDHNLGRLDGIWWSGG